MTDILMRPAGAGPEGPTPPQALDAERSVLAALLLDNEAIGRALEQLEPEAFYRTAHQKIYGAIVGLFNRSENVDLVTLAEELRKLGWLEEVGGNSALVQLMDYATTTANLDQHIKIIHSKAVLRGLIKASREIQEECFGAQDETSLILDRAESRIFAITDQRVRQGFIALKDLLKPAFEHIQQLFERKVLVTGVDTGYDDLNKMTAGLQNSDLVIIAGRPAMGKCLTAETLIDDPDSGERITIERYVRERRERVMGVNGHGRVRAARISSWVDSGVKPAHRVTTRLGRSVEVTGHHPFLTVHGWKPLHDLSVGARIAVPREVPVFGDDRSWSLERVRLLAYFIAEGGLRSVCPHFTNTDPVLVADFHRCLALEFPECGTRDAGDGITYRVARRPGHRAHGADGNVNRVTRWLRELGLMGKLSAEKELPECVWRWDRERASQFVRTLFSCDATVYSMSGYPRIEFTVASEPLARAANHLLTRFGVVSKLWRKTERSWRVEVTEPLSIRRYYQQIAWEGEKIGRFDILQIVTEPEERRSNVGHAPRETWDLLRTVSAGLGLSLSEVARRAGEAVARGYNLHARRGIARHRLARFASVLRSRRLKLASSPDLFWDEIVSIEPLGLRQVYDLTVPEGSNFIAEDVCVHNTSFSLNIAENAAIRGRTPVAVFSLEMSKEQLVQRLLCSQAEVPLHRLRNGFLSNEDWPRLTTAAGLLTQAPIVIDDSSALTVMEIRAKCRRLRAEGRLGLVIIDYLQLIRGHAHSENRVQEISAITRNLKALAKEMNVPIVALSQLSRQVETRDKSGRPQLSDLRESGCLTADSRVWRADNGMEVTLGELLAEGAKNIPVWTMDDDLRLTRGVMTHVFPSGVKPVFELRLASGKRVKASGNHPFYTPQGWQRVDELEVGGMLATVGDQAGRAMVESEESAAAEAVAPHSSIQSGTSAAHTVELTEAPARAVVWEWIEAIVPLGEQPVFDATVLGTHNFVANGIIAHNSIEQDADVVMFVYREIVYNRETPEPGKAQIIIAKQRNGPTGEVDLTFLRECTKFVPYSPMMPGDTGQGF